MWQQHVQMPLQIGLTLKLGWQSERQLPMQQTGKNIKETDLPQIAAWQPLPSS
jgi:hypothetical protein